MQTIIIYYLQVELCSCPCQASLSGPDFCVLLSTLAYKFIFLHTVLVRFIRAWLRDRQEENNNNLFVLH